MEDLEELLTPDASAFIKKLNTAVFPPKSKSHHWKGYDFIPGCSPKATEYAYKNWTFREGDVFLVSYPKTGTNWAKEIMRQILYRDETLDKLTNLLPINLRVLEIDPCEKFKVWDELPLKRRLIGTHLPPELIDVERIKQANAKVVYMLRNPKDQIVSWQKFLQNLDLSDEIMEMVDSGWEKYFEHVVTGECPDGTKRGEWYPDHIRAWYKYKDYKNFYFLQYEEMKKDIIGEIKKLAQFLEVSLCEEDILKIANATSFSNMKASKTSDDNNHSHVLAVNMRKGEVGGWKNHFTVAQSEQIDAILEEKLNGVDIQFTYEL
ncbi:amine sulfotransferase-like [Clavelina lepadiformis]|uniref:amine sulfotransferase-like n=1 Tax=Clavelina lepadiformis TaxID=159417 RepID=UPI004041C6C4